MANTAFYQRVATEDKNVSNQSDATCLRNLTFITAGLFGVFVSLIFLARGLVY